MDGEQAQTIRAYEVEALAHEKATEHIKAEALVHEKATEQIKAAQELAQLLGADYSRGNADMASSVLLGMSGRPTSTPTRFGASSSSSVASAAPASSMSYMSTPAIPSLPLGSDRPSMPVAAAAQVPYLDVDLGPNLGLDLHFDPNRELRFINNNYEVPSFDPNPGFDHQLCHRFGQAAAPSQGCGGLSGSYPDFTSTHTGQDRDVDMM